MAMGDIAFNLIIFFVILARAQDDSQLQWTPSKVSQVERGKIPRASVVIDVRNKVFLNGNDVTESRGNLAKMIEDQLAGVKDKDRIVHFKFHKDAPTRLIEPVFEAIGKAGADAFLVVEEE